MPDGSPVLRVEQLDIAAEQKTILSSLGSGDSTLQVQAYDRLAALAENHFPSLLGRAVVLTSDANKLADRVRDRVITADDESVETRKLITQAVDLINEMRTETPVGRVPLDTLSETQRSDGERRAHQIEQDLEARLSADGGTHESDNSDDDLDLVRFIVETRDPVSKGKLLVAQDLTKSYSGSSFRLRPISLELSRGEILGIVGVNASGKTTLLRMLQGDLKPNHGVLTYPSFDPPFAPKTASWTTIKRRIAYVSQTLPRWPGRISDNLWYVASIYGRAIADIGPSLDLLLKRYGLDKFADATWDEISGGYKTRFEIVRALLSKPDILILDEPLAYLDIISQQIVLRQLKQLARNRERPIGVIITSQQLYEIEAIADRLLVLDGGNTLFSGRIADLSRLIDDLVVEFTSSATISEIKKALAAHPTFRSLLSTETGYIAVFKSQRSATSAPSEPERAVDYNRVTEILSRETPGELSYIRNISNSCRILFEPRMAEWLNSKRVPQ